MSGAKSYRDYGLHFSTFDISPNFSIPPFCTPRDIPLIFNAILSIMKRKELLSTTL